MELTDLHETPPAEFYCRSSLQTRRPESVIMCLSLSIVRLQIYLFGSEGSSMRARAGALRPRCCSADPLSDLPLMAATLLYWRLLRLRPTATLRLSPAERSRSTCCNLQAAPLA